METRPDFVTAAKEILTTRYPNAAFAYVAGSIIRGEQTDYSDIDLVVVFEKLECATRESFVYRGWPVEAFVHDPETMNYFFQESDAKSGRPCLPQMVLEGLTLPCETPLSRELKTLAGKVINQGPPELGRAELEDRIYFISDLVDDLRAPRSQSEAIAVGARLFELLGDFYLRGKGQWSGSGKGLARALAKYSPDLANSYSEAFQKLFNGDSISVINLAQEILKPYGGCRFDGYVRPAAKDRRKKLDAR